MSTHEKVSLSEVNQSIETPKNNHFWQNLKAFLGPGALVAVGYMDPGNWITSVVERVAAAVMSSSLNKRTAQRPCFSWEKAKLMMRFWRSYLKP